MGPALFESSQNSSVAGGPGRVGGRALLRSHPDLFGFSAVQGWRTWKWMLAEVKPSHKTLALCLEK